MRKSKQNAILSILFVLISLSTMAGNKLVKIKTSAICHMCKNRIELVVNNLKGVKKSKLILDSGLLIVKYDKDQIDQYDIRKAISNSGYDADSLSANIENYNLLPSCCKKGSVCDTNR